MELADLARWTPIRFDFSGPVPTVDWADLSAERFVDPFFDETVARWAIGPAMPGHSSGPGSRRLSLSITSRHSSRRA